MDTKRAINRWFFFQGIFSLIAFTLCLYFYVEKQNYLTHLRIEIPKISASIRHLREDIAKCEYQIDQLENPMRLMQLASSPEFSHLIHPFAEGILTIREKEISKGPEWKKEIRSLPVALGTGK